MWLTAVTNAGAHASQKPLSSELAKDRKVLQNMHQLMNEHKLAVGHKASETELADFTVGVSTRTPGSSAPNAGSLTEADANALGFEGLSGLEAHLARRRSGRRTDAPVPRIPLCTEDHPENCRGARAMARHTDAPVPKIPLCTEDHPENCRGARAVGGSSVRVEVRALGGESERDALGIRTRMDEENASMRAAIRQAALAKAQAVGKPTAVALGYSGVQQLAAHLEREALGLE